MGFPLLFHRLLEGPGLAGFRLSDGVRTLAGREFRDQALRVAAGLARAGLGCGERLCIRLPNRVEVALAAFGASRAGAVFSILGPRLKVPELAYILADCGAAAFVCQADDLDALAAAREAPGLRRLILVDRPAARCLPDSALAWEALLEGPGDPPPTEAIDLDPAALFYTSGSTGFPKGVVLSHRNLRFTTWSISTYLGNHAGDRILCTLPLSFDYGFYQVPTALACGARLHLERDFAFPLPVLRRIEELEITGFPLVPAMLALIFQLQNPEAARLPALRYVTNTAQALPPALLARFRAAWPHVRVFSMYGLTECTRALYLDPSEVDRHPASVGRPIPGTRAWVERADGTPAAPGETGELMIQGSHVMLGYWGDPQATARLLRPGNGPGATILASGDLFVADEQGRFFFQGRKDDLLKVAGHKVYPLEVERVALQFPGVLEACLVGRPDPVQGIRLKLFLSARPGETPDPALLLRHLRASLEEGKLPREIEFLPELPRTETGKVSRRLLAERASGGA